MIIAASIYSRILGLAGLPNQLHDLLAGNSASFWSIMLLYVLLVIFLGSTIDTASIILIEFQIFSLARLLRKTVIRNVAKDNITDVIKCYLAEDMNPRRREITALLVDYMHAFARETNLTHEEWWFGIDFLEGSAAIETEYHHEFVRAYDLLGLSSLVDMDAYMRAPPVLTLRICKTSSRDRATGRS